MQPVTLSPSALAPEELEQHRPALTGYCYRMLGSTFEADDAVQETMIRALRAADGFEGRASLKSWLYRIATNVCLDIIRRRSRQVARLDSFAEIPWLQPYPDRMLDEIAPSDDEPDAVVVARETIELAFLAAIQLLPPRQRAVLILRDVLGWSAKETAALLDTSVPSVNSALQRARVTLKHHLPPRRAEWTTPDPTAEERALLQRYVDATERADAAEFVAMMREDARFSMPPQPEVYVGREKIVASWLEGGFGSESFGHIRCLLTRVNMQPAVANYVRGPQDESYRAFALDVLRVEEGAVAEIVTFGTETFPVLGLPPTL